MICAETFGCSGKSPYGETRLFADLAGLSRLGNYSRLSDTNLIVSIDRISRCSLDWREFADISFSHASRDIEVGFGTPFHALVCFEFGEDSAPEDRLALVESVRDITRLRNIELGKCHSAMTGSEVTSLVITLVGEAPVPRMKLASNGMVWISGKIGFAKLLYLESIRNEVCRPSSAAALIQPLNVRRFRDRFAVMSDVSGHALAGCLCDLAERECVAIEVMLTSGAAASSDVLEIPVTLLENCLDDFEGAELSIADAALRLSLLKETAGPVIAFSNELAKIEIEELESFGWRNIGSFQRGPASVSIGWAE